MPEACAFLQKFRLQIKGTQWQPGLAISLRGEAWLPAATAAREVGLSLCGLVGCADCAYFGGEAWLP